MRDSIHFNVRKSKLWEENPNPPPSCRWNLYKILGVCKMFFLQWKLKVKPSICSCTALYNCLSFYEILVRLVESFQIHIIGKTLTFKFCNVVSTLMIRLKWLVIWWLTLLLQCVLLRQHFVSLISSVTLDLPWSWYFLLNQNVLMRF
jgi:hypothetical protein